MPPTSRSNTNNLPSIKTSSSPGPGAGAGTGAGSTTNVPSTSKSTSTSTRGGPPSAISRTNTRSPHPMMSYYVPPQGMQMPSSSTSSPLSSYSTSNNNNNTGSTNGNGNGHLFPPNSSSSNVNIANMGIPNNYGLGGMSSLNSLGYGTSGFSIPTSNSRPTSPKGYGGEDAAGGSNSNSNSNSNLRSGVRFGAGSSGTGNGAGGGRHGNGTGTGNSSPSSSPHRQNPGSSNNIGMGTMHSNSNSNSNMNYEPPSKKRRLSPSNTASGGYHLPPPTSSYPHHPPGTNNSNPSGPGAGPSNFLAGLRGASDLPSPSSIPNLPSHHNHTNQMDDEDEDDLDSGEESDGDGDGYSHTGQGRAGSHAGGEGGGGQGTSRGQRGEEGKKGKKMKLTRGSRACTVCRRLKMKCVEADIDNGIRCLRCRNGNLECVFEESMRGKRSSKGKKSEIMARNLKDMENTLDTVLRSLHNPKLSLASGMTNLSPSASSGMLDSPSQGGNRTLDMISPGKDLMGAEQLDAQKPYTDMSVSHPARPGVSPLGGGNGDLPAGSPLMGRPGAAGHTSSSNVTTAAKDGPPSPRLHSLPDNTLNPLGLLAEASLQNRKRSTTNVNLGNLPPDGQGPTIESGLNGADALKSRVGGSKARTRESSVDEAGNPKRLGVGDASYFRPGPMSSLGLRRVIIERELKPEIFSFTTAAQINELFDIFFDKLHPNVPVLNKELHTPAGVCARSPFLLTTICAIASRFHPKHSAIRPKLAGVAKKLMFESPARGYKSLEIVQAYLLLVNWTLGPEERWEQDLSYLLLGMAIRIGTDMNLYKKNVVMPLDTEEGRLRDIEIANRERTWLLCFILDRSQSAQMGRPYSIREDVIVRESRYPGWFTRASSQPEDVVLAAYADMQRIMSRALDSLYTQQTTNSSGLVPGVDYPLIVNAVLDQLDGWLREWQFPLITQPADDEITVNMQLLYRAMADYYHQYNSLVLSSFALQYAIETSPLDLPIWFSKVHTAAMGVLTVVKVTIAPRGLLPSFTDGQLVMFCYACLSLLKLVRPEFKHLNRDPQTILNSLNEAIDTLSAAAVDEVHSVGLYATLLRNLVGNKQEELRTDWNAAEKERRTARHSRSATTLATVCNGALTMRNHEDEGLLWNPYVGIGAQSLPPPAQSMPGLNGTPVIVPDNSDHTMDNRQNDVPGSGVGAMNGTIWPHAAVSSAPTPTGEMHLDPGVHNGMHDGNGVFLDGLGAMSYGLEDINWENSLLMPGFGGFGQFELSGGFVHTQFGSGIISPNIGMTPAHSRPPSPRHMMHQQHPH